MARELEVVARCAARYRESTQYCAAWRQSRLTVVVVVVVVVAFLLSAC